MKQCKKCGYVLKETAGFCSNCGQKQDKEEGEIPESEEHSTDADVNDSKIARENLSTYAKKVSPTKWRFIIICFGVISLLVGCFGYVMDMRESKEVAEYKATNNIYALSNIVTSNANRSKKNKAIEALLEMEQPESLRTLEKLLGSDKETEKIILGKLTEKRIKLPSGIDILKNKNLSQGELIKLYFLSIESADTTLNNMKKIIYRLTREDKGYEKISSVLKNGKEIIDASGETDKELFSKIMEKNDQWMNEETKKESLNSKIKTISNDIGVSYANINKNIKEMHSYVMADYSAQVASRYMYADATTKNMVKATLENTDQLMRQTAEITSGGDPSVKAGIYADVATNMRPETYREVSKLGLQVLDEVKKMNNQKEFMKTIENELSALNSNNKGKSDLVKILWNDTSLFNPMKLTNTNKKMLGTSVYVYESEIPGYFRFINGRYGFSIDFPNSFNVALLAGNSAGASFKLSDGSAELSVTGGYTAGRTLDDYYISELKRIEKMEGEKGYFTKGENWFVATWKYDGKIYYEKEFVSEKFNNGFILSYPASQKDDYNEIVSNIEKTFIPGWKTGHKIWG